MKSLEILDKNIDWYGDVTLKASEVEKIKQDLEVLEIIKNKRVEVFSLLFTIRTNEEESNEYILIKYNSMFNNKLYELTMEEFLKLKQWLEEN